MSPLIIARRRRPAAATATHVPRPTGQPDPEKICADSRARVGVPGTVAGLALAPRKIRLRQIHARRPAGPGDHGSRAEGCRRVEDDFADTSPIARTACALAFKSAAVFLNSDGTSNAGQRSVRIDLATRLRHRRTGPKRFYEDPLQKHRKRVARPAASRRRRPEELPRNPQARPSPRHLSRLRYRLDAAAFFRRRPPHRVLNILEGYDLGNSVATNCFIT